MLCGICKCNFSKIRFLLTHWKSKICDPWYKVVQLKAEGKFNEAETAAAKAMGTYKPMPEEAKQALKIFYEEHKEEILARAKLKRMTQKAELRNLQAKSSNIKRKGF